MNRKGLTTDAVVSGGRNVERISNAIVSSAAPRTLISARLADRIAKRTGLPWRCTGSPSVPKACGVTTIVDVVIDGCQAATVRAVVAPLPRGLDLAIGRDVIMKSVKRIQFSPSRPARFVCRVPRR
jgi:hypothetical protein